MSTLNRTGRPPAVEGAFASYNPRYQVNAPLQAEPNGVALGRFAWADLHAKLAYSARQASDNLQGFVLPVPITGIWADWRYKYWYNINDPTLNTPLNPPPYPGGSQSAWILRGGMECSLAVRGDFWAKFEGGASPGQQVYANVADGTCLAVDRNSGAVAGYEPTPFYVATEAGGGCLAVITSWSFFTP